MGREPGSEGPTRRRRVFFALWPDEATRGSVVKATQQAVRASGGRPTRRENLHITVAFLGGVTAAELDRACGVPPVHAGAFELTLDTLGLWARPKILWFAPRSAPERLASLERLLWEGLAREGFEREKRQFAPHVTLCRRARALSEELKPVRWPADRLTLVESVPEEGGVRYEPIRHWPLAG